MFKRHTRYWHHPMRIESAALPIDHTVHEGQAIFPVEYEPMDTTAPLEDDTPKLPYNSQRPRWSFAHGGTVQFANRCMDYNVDVAISCLVQQTLFQSSVSIYVDTAGHLPSTTIQLFLAIAKLVVNTGSKQHVILSHLLNILLNMIPETGNEWPTMPCSLPAFRAHITNPTNQNSLVSLLPGPKVFMIDDDHAYCSLPEIAAFTLLLPVRVGAPCIPLRMHQLSHSKNMSTFMDLAPLNDDHHLVSVGLLFWLDGWDPSASTKNNCSPVHTVSVTTCYRWTTKPASCFVGARILCPVDLEK